MPETRPATARERHFGAPAPSGAEAFRGWRHDHLRVRGALAWRLRVAWPWWSSAWCG